MIRHYFSTAFRSFCRRPVATLIKLFVLSLGLTCFLLSFVVADYYGHSDSQFENADRIYLVAQRVVTPQTPYKPELLPRSSPPLAKCVQQDVPGLDMVARLMLTGYRIRVTANDKLIYQSPMGIDTGLLKMFDFPFVAGGGPQALAQPGSIIISKQLALYLFGRDDVVGETIVLQGKTSLTITGVMDEVKPPSFFSRQLLGTNGVSLLVSMETVNDIIAAQLNGPHMGYSDMESWAGLSDYTFVMLPKDGRLTASQVNRRLEGLGERHIPNASISEFKLIPLTGVLAAQYDLETLNNRSGISFATILLVFGTLILAVACLNFSNLAAAETLSRAKETGMRKVLGAQQSQLVTQHVVNIVILSLMALAGAVGVFEAIAGVVNQPVDLGLHLPSASRFSFWGGLVATYVAACLVGTLYPAIVLGRIRPTRALQVGKAVSGATLLRTLLIGAQFAVTGFLVVGIAIVYLQNRHVREASSAFNTDPLLAIYSPLHQAGVDYKTLRAELLEGPGIKSVTASSTPAFMYPGAGETFTRTPDLSVPGVSIWGRRVVGDYFHTLGVPLLAGRDLSDERDERAPSSENMRGLTPDQVQARLMQRRPARTILDVAAAKALGFDGPQAAVGQVIYQRVPRGRGAGEFFQIPYEIIGVVAEAPLEVRMANQRTHAYSMQSSAYDYPLIRVDRQQVAAAKAYIEAAWKRLAPNVPPIVLPVDQVFEANFSLFQRVTDVILGLAVLALVIANLGLIGMASFIVSRRTHEIGVRKTVGASTGQVLRLILWEFSKPVVLANMVAWPVVYVAAQVYLNLFTSRISLTPLPFVIGLAITLLVAWIVVGGQALRAARLKPWQVLRYE